MINRQTVLFGLSDSEDKNLMSSICDKAEKSIFSGRIIYTKFLSPRETNMVVNRLSPFVTVTPFGGAQGLERCVIAFSNGDEYVHYDQDDYSHYPIDAIRIRTKNKAVYSHRDYLGALMSLGISRELLGDIVILENEVILFCLSEITDYIMYNLTKISNTGVMLDKADLMQLNIPERHYKNISKTVSSVRLDCVVSACLNKSRSIATELVEKGLVNVNYEVVKSTSFILKDGDTVSVRGFGKMQIQFGAGLTKKGKIHLNIMQYI